jgi:hypothetical protein
MRLREARLEKAKLDGERMRRDKDAAAAERVNISTNARDAHVTAWRCAQFLKHMSAEFDARNEAVRRVMPSILKQRNTR